MASKTKSSLSNYFAALDEQAQAQSPVSDAVLQDPKKARARGVAFKVMAPAAAPQRTVARRTPAAHTERQAPRKAVYRSQLNKPDPVPVAKLPTPADFPQLWQGRTVSPGIWAHTGTIHAAVSLPDPMIAVKAAHDAEVARVRALVNMYKDAVLLDECDLEDQVLDAIEAKRDAEAAAVAREAKKKQPRRRRAQELGEDDIAPDETYCIEDGQVVVRGPEVEEPPMPRACSPEPEEASDSEDEYDSWEESPVAPRRAAKGGSWWDED